MSCLGRVTIAVVVCVRAAAPLTAVGSITPCVALTAIGPHSDSPQNTPVDRAAGMTYREAFKAAIAKLDLGKASEAVDLLREALRLRSASNEEIRLSANFFEPYAPNYYLSVALLKVGDCAGAQKSLAQAENSISQTNLRKQREALMQRCR